MIRLSRTGARKQPQYRVVVIEKERARNGRPVEVVGTYNPRTDPASIELKRERIDYWVSKGAKMSDRVGKIVAKPVASSAAPAAGFWRECQLRISSPPIGTADEPAERRRASLGRADRESAGRRA